jgi:DNA-directed RNA polymerase subunit RPC12/RpoP
MIEPGGSRGELSQPFPHRSDGQGILQGSRAASTSRWQKLRRQVIGATANACSAPRRGATADPRPPTTSCQRASEAGSSIPATSSQAARDATARGRGSGRGRLENRGAQYVTQNLSTPSARRRHELRSRSAPRAVSASSHSAPCSGGRATNAVSSTRSARCSRSGSRWLYAPKPMRVKALLCMLFNHKWEPAKVSEGPEPVMRCRRCGRTGIFSDETQSKMRRIGQAHDGFGNPLP